MSNVKEFSSCRTDTPEERRKSAETLVAHVLGEVEFQDILNAVMFQFTPVHHQSKQCDAAARYLGKDQETIRRWMHGITSPKAKDFWPLAFVAILQNLPVETQRDVMAAITGLTDE